MTEEQLGWILGIILPTTAIGVIALIYIKCRERKKRQDADYIIDTVKVIAE
jgi:predicted outer membrane lipoprotein